MSDSILLDLYVPTPPVQVCEERAVELVKKFQEKRGLLADLPAYIYNAGYLEAHYEVWGAVEQILDGLVKEFTESRPGSACRWDDVLAVWAYGKGFQAGLHHAPLAAKEKS